MKPRGSLEEAPRTPRGSPEELPRKPRGGNEGFVTRKPPLPPPGLPGGAQKLPGAAPDRKVAQVIDLGQFSKCSRKPFQTTKVRGGLEGP